MRSTSRGSPSTIATMGSPCQSGSGLGGTQRRPSSLQCPFWARASSTVVLFERSHGVPSTAPRRSVRTAEATMPSSRLVVVNPIVRLLRTRIKCSMDCPE